MSIIKTVRPEDAIMLRLCGATLGELSVLCDFESLHEAMRLLDIYLIRDMTDREAAQARDLVARLGLDMLDISDCEKLK